MCDKNKYTTKEINEKISLIHVMLMFELVHDMNIKKDYLQIFKLFVDNENKNLQIVEHSQEQPYYTRLHKFITLNPVEAKIYVVDDGEYSVMMFADEY